MQNVATRYITWRTGAHVRATLAFTLVLFDFVYIRAFITFEDDAMALSFVVLAVRKSKIMAHIR